MEHRPRRALCLGYPDALVTKDLWSIAGIPWDDVSKHADAAAIWRQHGRPDLQDTAMLNTKAAMTMMGAEVKICDAAAWGGEDFVLNLNLPVSDDLYGRFDLIVDPGTLEHCFDIAQAFRNVAAMLRPGGFAYHQAAMAFPNHGFWSISPTAFFDFYQRLGYELGRPYRIEGPSRLGPLVPRYVPVDPFVAVIPPGRSPMIGSYLFRKPSDGAAPQPHHTALLVQRCYSTLARDPIMTDFHADLLGADHPSLAGAREAA